MSSLPAVVDLSRDRVQLVGRKLLQHGKLSLQSVLLMLLQHGEAQRRVRLVLEGYCDASGEIDGFMMPLSASAHKPLQMEHSFRCPCLFAQGAGFLCSCP